MQPWKLDKILEKLKANKGCDINYDHLKNLDDRNREDLLELVNKFIQIIEELSSYIMNGGISSMISKGKGKPIDLINSWRCITICPSITRLVDVYFEEVLQEHLAQRLNRNQYGYRAGLPYTQCRVVVNECQRLARDRNEECFIGSIDAKAAFPSLNRDIMLTQFDRMDVTGDLWLYLDSIYSRTACVIKHGNKKTKYIREDAGARQGQQSASESWKGYQDPCLV